MIGNRKEEGRVCTIQLIVMRKSPTPSESRLTAILNWNKSRPILVQGLRQDIEINFNTINIYGSVDECLAVDLNDRGLIPSQGYFFHLIFF